MTKQINLIITICIWLTLPCCAPKSQSNVEQEYLSSLIEEYNFPKETEWIVILPGMGCHGCIQEGESFMKDYINAKNTNFILTRIESLKILQQKTGVKIKEHNNIIIDSADMVKIPTDNIIYPCILHIKNGKYIEHAFQSPQNSNAFNNLKMLLKGKNA